MKKIFALLLCTMLFCACSTTARVNNENMKKLTVGMTQAEVLQIMGEPYRDGGGEFARDENIWWYFTGTKWADCQISRDECTPLCFDPQTGTLLGWRHEFKNKYRLVDQWHE